MARRIFLYIGLPKTGTTFIQTTMWHNRGLLRERGLLYPGDDRFDHFHACMELRRRPAGAAAIRPYWDSLVDDVAAFDGDALITHEFFSMLRPSQIQVALDQLAPAEVHIVVSVRSYVLQWPAVWQEGLKMFVDSSFDDFMADALDDNLKGAWGWRSQNIPRVLARWGAVVPKERIHVITAPPPGSPRNLLWDRWVAAIGIDDTDLDRDVSFANSSLGAPQAALIQALKPKLSNELLDGPTRHRWFRQYFGHEVLVPQQGPRFGPREDVATALTRRSKQAGRVVRDGGYHVIGDLADLAYEQVGPPAAYPDDVSTEEMLEVALTAIEQMIRDHRRVTVDRDRLREAQHRRPSNPAGRTLGSRIRRRWRALKAGR